jgi:hypothetical protein
VGFLDALTSVTVGASLGLPDVNKVVLADGELEGFLSYVEELGLERELGPMLGSKLGAVLVDGGKLGLVLEVELGPMLFDGDEDKLGDVLLGLGPLLAEKLGGVLFDSGELVLELEVGPMLLDGGEETLGAMLVDGSKLGLEVELEPNGGTDKLGDALTDNSELGFDVKRLMMGDWDGV